MARPRGDDDRRAWARWLSAGMEPSTTGGVYVPYLSREGDERVEAVSGDNHDQLTAVKATSDPENLCQMNQTIEPNA